MPGKSNTVSILLSMSPEQVPPFPKARNKSNYGKNCDKCRIAADTSEKEELEYKS